MPNRIVPVPLIRPYSFPLRNSIRYRQIESTDTMNPSTRAIHSHHFSWAGSSKRSFATKIPRNAAHDNKATTAFRTSPIAWPHINKCSFPSTVDMHEREKGVRNEWHGSKKGSELFSRTVGVFPRSSAGADGEVEFQAFGQAFDPGGIAIGEAGGVGAADGQ